MRLTGVLTGALVLILAGLAGGAGMAEEARAEDFGLAAPPTPGALSPAPSDTFVPTATQVQRAASRRPCYARCGRRSDWQFSFAIPIWIPGVSGSFGSGGVEVETDPDTEAVISEFFDVESDLKFGFLGSFHARKGRWQFALDGFGARLGTSLNLKLVDGTLIDGEIYAIILRPTVKYEFLAKPFYLPRIGRGCFHASAVAGARYYGVGFDMNLPFDVNLKADESWLDPIVGLDLALDLSRKWRLTLDGDIGGFGVGSDFAWWLATSLEWRFARRWSLLFGYAFLDVTYGSIKDFQWNLHLNGPMMGIRFAF